MEQCVLFVHTFETSDESVCVRCVLCVSFIFWLAIISTQNFKKPSTYMAEEIISLRRLFSEVSCFVSTTVPVRRNRLDDERKTEPYGHAKCCFVYLG